VAVEQNRQPYKYIKQSANQLGLAGQVKAVNADAGSWSSHNQAQKFDIVLLDPPYNLPQFNILDRLVPHTKKHGIVVLSWPASEEPPVFAGCTSISVKKYGDAQLVFYRKD
jgi:16S rRNA G966 N2-methylase RsmD